LPQIIDLNRWI